MAQGAYTMDKARKWKLKRNRAKRSKMKPQRQQARKETKDAERETLYPDSSESELCPLWESGTATKCTSLSFAILLLPPVSRKCRIRR